MSELEKAARQALAALEVSTDWDVNATGKQAQSMRAIIALRQCLEQQPAVSDEPVAWMWQDGTLTTDPDRADGTWTHLYTSPQKREWVGLTVADIYEIADDYVFIGNIKEIAHAIEAKLKEKNK